MSNTDRIGFHKFNFHTQDGQNYNKRVTARAVRAFKARRKVMPGFPIREPFESIEDVRHYLEGDRITCLICGKDYRRLGIHLHSIHGIREDDYRAYYRIPWTYGLACSVTSKRYSKAVRKRFKDGWTPPMKLGDEQLKMARTERRKSPYKEEVGIQNLGDHGTHKRKLTVAPDGSMETFTQRRERLTTKRGTKEFHEKMRARPQCQPEHYNRYFINWWKGKKQSPEHVAKRVESKRITLEGRR